MQWAELDVVSQKPRRMHLLCSSFSCVGWAETHVAQATHLDILVGSVTYPQLIERILRGLTYRRGSPTDQRDLSAVVPALLSVSASDDRINRFAVVSLTRFTWNYLQSEKMEHKTMARACHLTWTPPYRGVRSMNACARLAGHRS